MSLLGRPYYRVRRRISAWAIVARNGLTVAICHTREDARKLCGSLEQEKDNA
jgi:hypothetical protein